MIKLDENSKYKLTKVGIKDLTKNRMIHAGDSLTGDASIVDTDKNKMVLVTKGFEFLRTSPIRNIQDQGNGNFLIETDNSFYSLERVNNEDTTGTTTT